MLICGTNTIRQFAAINGSIVRLSGDLLLSQQQVHNISKAWVQDCKIVTCHSFVHHVYNQQKMCRVYIYIWVHKLGRLTHSSAKDWLPCLSETSLALKIYSLCLLFILNESFIWLVNKESQNMQIYIAKNSPKITLKPFSYHIGNQFYLIKSFDSHCKRKY